MIRIREGSPAHKLHKLYLELGGNGKESKMCSFCRFLLKMALFLPFKLFFSGKWRILAILVIIMLILAGFGYNSVHNLVILFAISGGIFGAAVGIEAVVNMFEKLQDKHGRHSGTV